MPKSTRASSEKTTWPSNIPRASSLYFAVRFMRLVKERAPVDYAD